MRYAAGMRARSRRRSSKSSRWLLALAVLAVLGLGAAFMLPTLVMGWVRNYLQQEAFRSRLQQALGTEVAGEVRLSSLRWAGDSVTANEAGLLTAQGWRARLGGLHVTLDWNAFRQGKWRLVGSGADSFVLERSAAKASPSPTVPAAAEAVFAEKTEGGAVPSWLQSYLPDTTEVDGVALERVSVLHPGPWNLRDARVKIGAWQQGDNSIQAVAEGGVVETPVVLPAQTLPVKLSLGRASLRLSRGEVHLKEASLKWLDAGDLTVRGKVTSADGRYDAACHFSQIPLSECLTEDWRLRLSGRVEGDVASAGLVSQTAPVVTGTVHLKDGVLTALPVLDRLAAYTGVERFKRLVLDVASADIRLDGGSRRFEKVLLRSNGLMQLEGSLQVTGENIEGNFLLGVTPETLKWLPGAQQHVFTTAHSTGAPGMLWTPLRITGTLAAPREDLSGRLAAAAGRALLDVPANVVGGGSEMLLTPVLGKEAGTLPREVLKGATDATGKAVETGVQLLQGLGGGLLGK